MTESSPVLVLNAGSSTLKYGVVDLGQGDASWIHGSVERLDSEDDFEQALRTVHDAVEDAGVGADGLLAVGHRVVHGGPDLVEPRLVDDDVVHQIERAARLAPLHNPPALAGIRSARSAYPHLPQVVVFDTAFFADLPARAATYAIDRDLAAGEDVRRYGAHGISHEYVAREAAELLGREGDPDLALVTLHLGNGASAAAIRGGRPVDTSMGLTPLEGLVMGSRGGDVDPGVLLHLMRHADLGPDDLEDLLHHRSGLAGLAGVSDFRDLLAAVDRGDARARTAFDVYCHRLRKYVGAYHAVLGGADAVVFTAGVGEHTPRLRADALAGLDALGIAVDPTRNEADDDEPRVISPDGARVAVLVVPTDEELSIARQAVRLLAG